MSDSPDSTTSDAAALQQQLDATRAELAEVKDKYLRLAADNDNFRKMQGRRAEERVKQEKKNLLVRVIEVIDDLERAMIYQETATRETLLTALKHTYTQLNAVLAREGVVSLQVTGEAFDPHVHEAVDHVSDSGKPEGEVVLEVQKGYLYGDELLRPARVNVSAGEGTPSQE
jgi:molecular chaperone GrpE